MQPVKLACVFSVLISTSVSVDRIDRANGDYAKATRGSFDLVGFISNKDYTGLHLHHWSHMSSCMQ
jgi:hypothetical protein